MEIHDHNDARFHSDAKQSDVPDPHRNAEVETGVGTALARLLRDPDGAIAELKSQFTNDSMKKESAALNAHINLCGFWNETAFLTKSGDVGMILSIPGVDYECLDRSQQEYAVKRLEAALKAFGPSVLLRGFGWATPDEGVSAG